MTLASLGGPVRAHADDTYDASTPTTPATLDVAVHDAEGWHADLARAFVVGCVGSGGNEGRVRAQRLVDAADAVTAAGVAAIRPGGRWIEAARAMGDEAARHGVEVVAGHDGHGLGRSPHERPRVPMAVTDTGLGDFECRPGLVFTVEPIVREARLGSERVPWCACREAMVAVTASGVRVLGA